jgi:hypothetical protein
MNRFISVPCTLATLACLLLAASLSAGDDKGDAQAKEATSRFFKALLAKDLDGLLAVADVPWSDENNVLVKEREELRKVFRKGFDHPQFPKDAKSVSFNVVQVVKYGQVRERLRKYERKFVKFVDQVLADGDRVVIVEHGQGKDKDRTVVYVRMSGKSPRVVGVGTNWLKDAK